MPALSPLDVVVGQTSSTDDLLVTSEAYDGLNVYLLPADGQVWWSESPTNVRKATVTGFSSWEVLANDTDYFAVQMDDGTVMEAFAVGLIRFSNVGGRFLFLSGSPQSGSKDDPPFNLGNPTGDGWWLSATSPWSISSGVLNLGGTDDFTFFYEVSDRQELIARRLPWSVDDLRIGGSVVEKWLRATRGGFWVDHERDLAQLNVQAIPATKTGGTLTKWGRQLLSLQRGDSESDSAFRLRVQGELRARFGGVTPDSIIAFAESLLGASQGDITIQENIDPVDGHYRPGFFTVTYSTDLLSALGFTAPFDPTVASVNAVLERVAAAGVVGQSNLATSATYNTSNYDGTDAYGT